VRLWRRDQYGRVVGTAHVRRGLFSRDVSLAMLRAGMATIYEAKVGSEFGGREQQYKDAEERAKRNRVGMWTEERSVWARLIGRNAEERESPREYKTRMAQQENVQGKK
jgi:endonuclease YncB( thermonuclease family)